MTDDDGSDRSAAPLVALGSAVRHRRRAMGLAQGDLARRGGPAQATIRRLELGTAGEPRPKTRAQLERALYWPHGTVDTILEQEDPSYGSGTLAVRSEDLAEALSATGRVYAMGDVRSLEAAAERAEVLALAGSWDAPGTKTLPDASRVVTGEPALIRQRLADSYRDNPPPATVDEARRQLVARAMKAEVLDPVQQIRGATGALARAVDTLTLNDAPSSYEEIALAHIMEALGQLQARVEWDPAAGRYWIQSP